MVSFVAGLGATFCRLASGRGVGIAGTKGDSRSIKRAWITSDSFDALAVL
jgi:hypothetical protein